MIVLAGSCRNTVSTDEYPKIDKVSPKKWQTLARNLREYYAFSSRRYLRKGNPCFQVAALASELSSKSVLGTRS